MHDDKKMAGPDFLASIVLIGLGVATMVLSSQMRVFRSLIISPGLFPFILGGVFIFFGAVLMIIAVRRGGPGRARRLLAPAHLLEIWRSPRFRRGMIIFLLILGYVLLFGNRSLEELNFTIAAGAYIIPVNPGFMGLTACYLFLTFSYLKAMRWQTALIVSLIASAVIFYTFNKGFGIPIP